jgi:hypothetical protein
VAFFVRTFAQESVAMTAESKLGKFLRALLGRRNRGSAPQPTPNRQPSGKSKPRQPELRDIGSLVL